LVRTDAGVTDAGAPLAAPDAQFDRMVMMVRAPTAAVPNRAVNPSQPKLILFKFMRTMNAYSTNPATVLAEAAAGLVPGGQGV
jgi:hypothetical protein